MRLRRLRANVTLNFAAALAGAPFSGPPTSTANGVPTATFPAASVSRSAQRARPGAEPVGVICAPVACGHGAAYV